MYAPASNDTAHRAVADRTTTRVSSQPAQERLPPWIACVHRSASSDLKFRVWSEATAKSSMAICGSRPRASSGITEIPVILCDEWTPAQVKAFRLMVNRSVTWADWDEELLALELQEIQESDFDLIVDGIRPRRDR